MNWRLRIWLAVLLAVALGVGMAVLVVTAHFNSTSPVVDSTIVWER